MKLNVREGLKLSGKIKIDTYRAGMVEAITPYLEQRKFLRQTSQDTSAIDQIITDIKAAFFIRTAIECPNLIMDSPNCGIDLIVQNLAGMTTYPLPITFGEIGTGSTTPALTDTALTTPTNRAAVGFQQDYGTTDAIVQFFFSDSQLANQTYNEFGAFCGGTTTIGSGQLFEHALISPGYAKTAGTDTTVQVDINIANS